MIAPVLYQEMLLGGRRNRAHFFRWCYAGWIVLQLIAMLFGHTMITLTRQRAFDFTAFAEFSRSYLETLVTQNYLVLLLATPVLTAGAITDEKTRGTLQYLLVTELLPRDILIGKLMARLYQVLLIALTPLPVICFLGVFGGLDLSMLLSLGVSSLAMAWAIGSMSLLASVVCRHTRDAVLGLYTSLAIFYFGGAALQQWLVASGSAGPSIWMTWLETLLNCLDPLHPMGNGWSLEDASQRNRHLAASVTAWGLLGLLCLVLAILRLRGSYLLYLEHSGSPRWWQAFRDRNWLTRRAKIGADPLGWKERHVEGIAPLALLRALPRWLGVILVLLLTTASSLSNLAESLPPPNTVGTVVAMSMKGDIAGLARVQRGMSKSDAGFYFQGLVVMLLGGLVIAIRCSGAVTGEREKSTWEALLLTPLETRQLIRGKLWGITGASVPYLIAYGVPALFFSAVGGPGAFFWVVVWLGVTLLAMGFAGAAGLWCSVRAKTSWRSLLGTLGITYIGGFILYCVTTPIMFILAILFYIGIQLVEARLGLTGAPSFASFMDVFGLAMCATLAAAFAFMAWRFVVSAEYRVSVLERTKHWHDEPKHPRWSRHARERLNS